MKRNLEKELNEKLFLAETKIASEKPLVRLDKRAYLKIIWIQGMIQRKTLKRHTLGQVIDMLADDYITSLIASHQVNQKDIELLEELVLSHE